jgi:hypothetical protein
LIFSLLSQYFVTHLFIVFYYSTTLPQTPQQRRPHDERVATYLNNAVELPFESGGALKPVALACEQPVNTDGAISVAVKSVNDSNCRKEI